MVAGAPFMMIADEQDWLLRFERAQERPRHGGLLVILGNIAGLRAGIGDLKINRVVGGELLLDLRGKGALLDIVVGTLAGIAAVVAFEGVAAVPERAVLRPVFVPRAAALVFGEGTHAGAVALEQLRVFLL